MGKSRLSIILLSVLCFFSCAQKQESIWDDPKFIKVVVSTEKIAASPQPFEIKWKEGQTLKVFSQSGEYADLVLNKPGDNVFYSYDWMPQQVPVMAVYSASDAPVVMSEGTIALEIPSCQKPSAPETVESIAAVGLVTGTDRTDYKVKEMRNLSGFLSLYIGHPHITQVKIESLSGENMTGKATVDLKQADENAPVSNQSESENSSYVTIVPQDDSFDSGMYYVAVLPGIYAEGFKVTAFSGTEAIAEQTCFSDGVSVSHSQSLFLTSFSPESVLPEELTIEVDFTLGWPFNEQCAQVQSQTHLGESYSYNYRQDGNGPVTRLDFIITRGSLKGDKSYQWEDGALWFDSDPYEVSGSQQVNSTAMIALPVIPDMYLKEVRAFHDNHEKPYPRFNFNKGFLKADGQTLEASYGFTYGRIAPGQPTVMSLPFTMSNGTVIESQLGQIYSLRMRDNDVRLTKFTLKYSKTL